MKKEVIKMSGPVCCYQCATTIEKEVMRLTGMKNAEMEYKKGLMTVEYDEKVVNKLAIQKKAEEVLRRFETQQ